jgi:hypothetical protein
MHYRYFFALRSSFTIIRKTIHGFTTSIDGSTTSIGMQHFQQISRVSMLPTEVPQPLQHPMLLYKSVYPLSPSTLIQLQRGVATFTQHFRGSTTSHYKYIFNISNGYFMKSHLASWFERYHRFNLSKCLTQGGRA